MAYLVRLSSRAEREVAVLYDTIHAGESEAALRWYEGLKEAVLTLQEEPSRCSITPESKGHRHLLYGNKPHSYRVIYRIDEVHRQVNVVHIRHGAQRPARLN